MTPGDTYTAELAQAAGVVRDCYDPMAGIPASVPIWFTENGVPTGALSEAQQAAALSELVQAACAYSGTFNITDYRWFNLRDANSNPPTSLLSPTFSSFGLLRDDYTEKPSFAAYRAEIEACGAHPAAVTAPKRTHRRRRSRRRARHRRRARRRSPGTLTG